MVVALAAVKVAFGVAEVAERQEAQVVPQR
jgi:hypothetical protein